MTDEYGNMEVGSRLETAIGNVEIEGNYSAYDEIFEQTGASMPSWSDMVADVEEIEKAGLSGEIDSEPAPSVSSSRTGLPSKLRPLLLSVKASNEEFDHSKVPASMVRRPVSSAISSKKEKGKGKEKEKTSQIPVRVVESSENDMLSESGQTGNPVPVSESLVSQHELSDLRLEVEGMSARLGELEGTINGLVAERDVIPGLLDTIRKQLNQDMTLMQAKLSASLEFNLQKDATDAAKVLMDKASKETDDTLSLIQSASLVSPSVNDPLNSQTIESTKLKKKKIRVIK